MKKATLLLLAFLLVFTGTIQWAPSGKVQAAGTETTVYLSDLNWLSETSGWAGKPSQKDKNVNGGAIKLADGNTYAKGIGTHANSEIVYQLNGGFNKFLAVAGLDNSKKTGTVTFSVYGDNLELFNSGKLSGSNHKAPVDINVSGVQTLKLLATDSGDGNSNDWANWADARLVQVQTAATMLSEIRVNDIPIPEFVKENLSYDIEIEEGSPVPVITASAIDANASVVLQPAASIPGTTSIRVTNGAEVSVYKVQFKLKNIVYLSDLNWTSETSGYRTVQKDSNVGGTALTLAGTTYAKGLGTHANSVIKYDLGGQYSRFQSHVGLGRTDTPQSTVEFIVKCDGRVCYSSGVISGDFPHVQRIDIPIEGVNALELILTDANDTNNSDWGNWADARLVKGDSTGTLLSGIEVNSVPIAGFQRGLKDYDVELPVGTVAAPPVNAIKEDPAAVVDVIPAAALPGTTEIRVTKDSHTTVYRLHFTVLDAGLKTVELIGDKIEINPLLKPDEVAQLTVIATNGDGSTVDLSASGVQVEYSIESTYKSSEAEVATIDGNGIVRPAKDASGHWVGGVAKAKVKVTANGRTKEDTTNVVVRPFYLDYSKTLVMKYFMGRDGTPSLTFEQALEATKKIDSLTRGIPKVVYLVGWQFEGHDSKYPSWGEVNVRLKRPQDATAEDSLIWLMEEAKKYNTTISLHMNMTTAFPDSPLWDTYVAADLIGKVGAADAGTFGGKVVKEGDYTIYGGSYAISYFRDWNSGLLQQRIQDLIKLLPPLKDGQTIHTDAFHLLIPSSTNPTGKNLKLSGWHQEREGYTNADEVKTMRKIYQYWRDQGFDLTSEFVDSYRVADGVTETFVGLQPMAWHFRGIGASKEWSLNVPASLYTGGDGQDARYGFSMLGEGRVKENNLTALNGFLQDFALNTLPWYYLNRLQRLSDDGMTVRFSNNVQSYMDGDKVTIKQGDRVLRSGEDVFIPALWSQSDKEIIAYSKAGYTNKVWSLPSEWSDISSVDIYKLSVAGLVAEFSNVAVVDGKLTLTLAADSGVSIVPAGTDVNAVAGIALDKEHATLLKDEVIQLNATVQPEQAVNRNVEWESSDPAIATVDQTGRVTGIAYGTALITVTTDDGKYSRNSVVQVAPPQVEPPKSDVPSKVYYEPKTIALTSDTPGASIYYTVGGAEPSASSTLYTAPIVLQPGISVIRAIAVKAGMSVSDVGSYAYKIQLPSDTAAAVAMGITSIAAPGVNATTLALPTVPPGFTVAIKSTDRPDVIALNGSIVPPSTVTTVALVLEVTRISDGTKADTTSLSVTVPAFVKKVTLQSSNALLRNTFQWATGQALQFVQTGKSGPVNVNNNAGQAGPFTYIPSYWAGYKHRTAFYSRDFVHQSAGAHMIGLDNENFSMFKTFAQGMTEARKWYTLWAYNFDGSNYTIDWKSDTNFVREVPAQFELVEKAYKQYLWTGNEAYINDPDLWNFYSKVMTDYIAAHDTNGNGVAEGTGNGIFAGAASYNERSGETIIEAGDAIGSQYQAFLAYANMLKAKGMDAEATAAFEKAQNLKDYFNEEWSVKIGDETGNYSRALNIDKVTKYTDFGKENSWFMPMKLITEPGQKNSNYLDYISGQIGDGLKYASPESKATLDKPNSPANIEAYSYLPDTFYPYNRVNEGWKWLKFLMQTKDYKHEQASRGTLTNGEYPEISYTIIGNVIEGLMGIEPNAPRHSVVTAPRLAGDVPDVKVDFLPIGQNDISVAHMGNSKTELRNIDGTQSLSWEARFYGDYPVISLDGTNHPALYKTVNGVKVSYITTTVAVGSTVVAEALSTGTADKAVAPASDKTSGSYDSTVTVTLTTPTADAKIYYTLDGTTPTRDSNVYSGAFVIQRTASLKAFAASENKMDSNVATYEYTIEAATVQSPASNLATGTYHTPIAIELITTTAGADIYYTINGTMPTKSSFKYTTPIEIDGTTKLKAIAFKDGWVDSEVATFDFAIVLPQASSPTASKPSGFYDKPIRITLESESEGASIYYTTNGESPTTNDTLYAGAFDISDSTTLKTVAVKHGYADSDISTFVYRILDGELPAPASAPAYLSDLEWLSATSGWSGHPPLKDRAINSASTPIKINGKTYAKGIGTHASSTIKYIIGGGYGLFKAVIGIDDVKNVTGSASTMWFEVLGDGFSLYKSPTLEALNGPALGIPIEVDITGVTELTLVVNDAGTPIGNPTNSDHADWANAQILPRIDPVPQTAAEIAAMIATIAAPAKDATELTLPSLPAGYSVAIKSSSNPGVVALNGTIVPPSADTTVNLVLQVTRTSDGSKAETVSIAVIVPSKSVVQLTAAEVAATIVNIAAPAKDAKVLTLPGVPSGFTVAIKTTSQAGVVALNGTIVPPSVDARVNLVLEVTRTSDGSKAETASITVIVPAKSSSNPSTDPGTNPGSSQGGDTAAGNGNGNASSTYTVKDQELKVPSNRDEAVINVPESTKSVIVPIKAALQLGQNDLVIRMGAFSIELPGAMLMEWSSLVNEADRQDAKLVLKVDPIKDRVTGLLTKEQSKGNAEWKVAGAAFDISLALVAKDGTVIPLKKFDNPITIRLKLNQSSNTELSAIYYIADNGELTYIGGTLDNGELVAEVSHFSNYAILEMKKIYKDVPLGHWAEASIQALAAKRIVLGTSDTQFSPTQSVTRAEFAAMLVRALGLSEKGTLSFIDVDAKAWYLDAIAIASKAGIINGKSESRFDPNGSITREEMTVMLMRAWEKGHGKTNTASTEILYQDQPQVSAWALESVKAASALNFVAGHGGKFAPSGISSRAEAATVISRLLKFN